MGNSDPQLSIAHRRDPGNPGRYLCGKPLYAKRVTARPGTPKCVVCLDLEAAGFADTSRVSAPVAHYWSGFGETFLCGTRVGQPSAARRDDADRCAVCADLDPYRHPFRTQTFSVADQASGEPKRMVRFSCSDCGAVLQGPAADSPRGIHGLTCVACGCVHAEGMGGLLVQRGLWRSSPRRPRGTQG